MGPRVDLFLDEDAPADLRDGIDAMLRAGCRVMAAYERSLMNAGELIRTPSST